MHPRVSFRDGDHGPDAAAHVTFSAKHPFRLSVEILFPKRVAGVFGMPAPDHGFYIVLEQNPSAEIVDVHRGSQKIAHHGIRRFAPPNFFDGPPELRAPISCERERQGRKQISGQLSPKFRRSSCRCPVRHRIYVRRIFLRSRHRFRRSAVVKTYIVNFVTQVQTLQHLQRPDLSATAGRMQKIGLDPENLHSSGDDFRSGHPTIPLAGEEHIAPHLEIQ